MSYTFSRRDFLKYSALTVVAVAGAGMLSGCEIQDPNNPVVAVGKESFHRHYDRTADSGR